MGTTRGRCGSVTDGVMVGLIVLGVIFGVAVIAIAIHEAYAAGWNACVYDQSKRDPDDPTRTVYQ
jgi:hypothetical protein